MNLHHAGRRRALRIAMLVGAAALTLAPIARMVYILATTGAGNPSNDDQQLFTRFIGPVLAGSYNWSHLPHDVFLGNHFDLLPALVLLLFARLAHYNVRLILYAGVLLAVAKFFLYQDS